MAYITNVDNNLRLEICFKRNETLDYDIQRSEYENWIPFVLYLTLPKKSNMIDDSSNAMMTIYEVRNLIHGIEKVNDQLKDSISYIYEFCSSEGFFGLKFEVIPEDFVAEIELWINVGNQTGGRVYGYDEGVRFIANKESLMKFMKGLREEIADSLSNTE